MITYLPYYLGFSHCLGIGPTTFQALVTHFGNVQKAYEATETKLNEVLGTALAKKFLEFRKSFDPSKKLEELQKKEVTILTLEDERYPTALKNISDAPICLYVKGNIKEYNFNDSIYIGIVGTRKATSYGIQITQKFSYELAQGGLVVVSGLALGIDAVAHTAALNAGGKTIAFLGCGVDIIYPQENHALYHRIIKEGGLVISEFPPGQTVRKGLFVARNRLISGLSQGVLVVEGLKNSGSLITARYAAEQGKTVFAPPSPLTSPLAEAPHLLLKEGAKLVISVEDILEEFNLTLQPITLLKSIHLSPVEKQIIEKLTNEPKLPDDLAIELQTSIQAVLSVLSSLEIQGVIEKNSEGKYQVKL